MREPGHHLKSQSILGKAGYTTLLIVVFSIFFVSEEGFSFRRIVQQQAYLNIPAYMLNLYTQYDDGRWERLAVPVGVGQGPKRQYQTPTGQGELYAKENKHPSLLHFCIHHFHCDRLSSSWFR